MLGFICRATGTPSSAGAARLQPSPSADDVGARLQAMALLRPSAAAGQLSSNFDTAASAAKRLLNPAAAAPVRSALGSGLSPRASITGVLSSPRASVAGGLGMGAGGIGSGGLSSPRASITGGLGLSAGSMGGLLSDRTGMAGAGSRAPLLAASSSLMGPSAWSPRSARASDTGGTAGGASDVAARLAAMRSKFTDFKSRSSTLSAAPSFAS